MLNLFLVEDNHDIRTQLEVLLKGEPEYQCHSFRNAEEAIAHLKHEVPDIILMDIHLPGMSGIDATRYVVEKYPSVQVMMLTIYEDDDKIFRALKAGASGYMLKKTKPAELITAIEQLKKGYSPMRGEI